MKKVLIAYYSLSGNTERMAQYVAEGVRISGQQAVVKKIADIKTPAEMEGYDGYVFASPTYHREMAAEAMYGDPLARMVETGLGYSVPPERGA